jgi:hypothetical protein
MCLAASSSSVCENSGVVSIEYVVQQTACRSFVDVVLCGVLVENSVKSKCLVLDPFALRQHILGEALDGVVLWRVEYSVKVPMLESEAQDLVKSVLTSTCHRQL